MQVKGELLLGGGSAAAAAAAASVAGDLATFPALDEFFGQISVVAAAAAKGNASLHTSISERHSMRLHLHGALPIKASGSLSPVASLSPHSRVFSLLLLCPSHPLLGLLCLHFLAAYSRYEPGMAGLCGCDTGPKPAEDVTADLATAMAQMSTNSRVFVLELYLSLLSSLSLSPSQSSVQPPPNIAFQI